MVRLRATPALGPGFSADAGNEAKMMEQPPRGDIEQDSIDVVGATGQDLREQREALGADLVEIAETLCIRRGFLEALEAGDYDALPGPTYAVGFVRSYANHLGLDGDKLAGQYKIEISGERPTAKLDFFTPVQESRIPRGAMVLVTVLLAFAIYGVWYYMNARDLTFSDLIPEVPPLFGRTAEAPAPPLPADPGATASPQGGPAGEKTASGPVAASGAPPSPEVAMDRQAAVPPPPAASATGAGAVAEIPPPAPAEAAGPPQSAPAEAAAVLAPAPAEAAPAMVSTRIEIRAKADSWVQVRTAEGTLLVTRILGRGTSYAVPPQKGLRLTTGNAGGLEILVDGVPVPPLGPFGAVRHDVALDPERLKAGTALAR
ncbi:MAG: DUF4115 domain-containing protein [Alphaproteobacteria bacterium]|nr:DUF4115 domain-containing protein [Alphaproteobacteria bacterium]